VGVTGGGRRVAISSCLWLDRNLSIERIGAAVVKWFDGSFGLFVVSGVGCLFKLY